MEVTVKKIWKNPTTGKWPKGRVDVTVVIEGVAIDIYGITVADSKKGDGMYIGMPSQQSLKRDPESGYLVPQVDQKTGKPIYYKVVELSKDAHFELQNAILEQFGTEQVATRATANATATRRTTTTKVAAAPAAKTKVDLQVGNEPTEEDPPF